MFQEKQNLSKSKWFKWTLVKNNIINQRHTESIIFQQDIIEQSQGVYISDHNNTSVMHNLMLVHLLNEDKTN